jgi:SAM-dependent methyltransferase
MAKAWLQSIWDFMGMPFRLALFDQNWLPRFGWTTLEEERINAVLPYIKGKLLDIGAGYNNLVIRYENGIGVDVFDWGAGALVVEDSSKLPFENNSFDTITFVACLNHIPNRSDVLHEARRLLKKDGQIIITMIGPLLGNIGHAIWWYGEDRKRGGMKEGEVGGMTKEDIIKLCEKENMSLILHKRFVYHLNNLYLFKVNNELRG